MIDQPEGGTDSCAPVNVINRDGESRWLFVCEHASNFIPERFNGLGLNAKALKAHIAWDPGAVEVARGLSAKLNAPLVESGLSRLLIDCNRPIHATDLIPELSETTLIPGNHDLSPIERKARIDLSHRPFHTGIEGVISDRAARGLPSWIVTIHSFTPVYRTVSRPWQIGIIHDEDDRVAKPLIAALAQDKSLNVGINEPYAPADRVYYTLERHARPRNTPCVMIELRNNEIASADTQTQWADRLAIILSQIENALLPQTQHIGSKA